MTASSKDQIVDSLAALARESEGELPQDLPLAPADVEGLVRGTLSQERLAELRRQADGDPDLAAALACFTPLPPSTTDEIARLAVARLQGGRKPRRRFAFAWLAMPVLAAAAGLLLLVRPGGGPVALPAYDLTFVGGDGAVRGETGADPRPAVVRLWPDAEMDLVLRPEAPVTGPLQASAFVRAGAGLRAVPLPFELSDVGAVRVAGPVGKLFAGLRGRVELVIVLRRSDVSGVPAAPELAAAATASGPGWLRITAALELAAPGR
jgi:hypothetical protein